MCAASHACALLQTTGLTFHHVLAGRVTEEILPTPYSPASGATARQKRADARGARQAQQEQGISDQHKEAKKKKAVRSQSTTSKLPISFDTPTLHQLQSDNEYERKRQQNMARNHAILASFFGVMDQNAADKADAEDQRGRG